MQLCTQAAPYASRPTAAPADDPQQSFSAIQDVNSSEFSTRFASLHTSYNASLYTTIHNFITRQYCQVSSLKVSTKLIRKTEKSGKEEEQLLKAFELLGFLKY